MERVARAYAEQAGYEFHRPIGSGAFKETFLEQKGLVSAASNANPFGAEIIKRFTANEPWVRFSWRQFMWWFWNVEDRLSHATVSARELVETADANWGALEAPPKSYFEERTNDGAWIRQWRALEELDYFV